MLCLEYLLWWSCRCNYTAKLFLLNSSPLGRFIPVIPLWLVQHSDATLLSTSVIAPWTYCRLGMIAGRSHPIMVESFHQNMFLSPQVFNIFLNIFSFRDPREPLWDWWGLHSFPYFFQLLLLCLELLANLLDIYILLRWCPNLYGSI